MWEEFKQYLHSIKPTRKGILALVLALVLVPAITDLFLIYFALGKHHDSFFITPFMVMQSIGFIPLLCIYLVAFFIIAYLFKQLFEKKH